MTIVYDKLWQRLIDMHMQKQELREAAGISRASMAKLAKNENVTTDVLAKVCAALDCDIADIAEFRRDTSEIPGIESNSSEITYRVNSFFAGIGGFDVGFEKHGFRTTLLCEINPFCNEILTKHWPNVQRENDICTIDATKLPEAEVWCGGFPCQDISVARGAAQRLGLGGSRSGLFYQYAALLEAKLPQVVIIENVEGLYNSNGGRDFGVILQKLTSMGYAVAWRLFNSRYFGVPQSRSRVYLCCWLRNPEKAMRVMFDHAGAAKTENERKDFVTESNAPNAYPKVPKTAYCLAATSGRHTGTDWSRTYVVCQDGVRRLTPKEYERLQGFDDLWTMPLNYAGNDDDIDTLRYTALGNAVSVPVVEWVAKRVHTQLEAENTEHFMKKNVTDYVPEFAKSEWSPENLYETDFTDDSRTYKWPRAGLAWDGSYVGGNVNPTPAQIVPSVVYDIVERETVSRRYYLTPNAAEGILRRVDNQGRQLFAPLRAALELEKAKK